MAYKYITRYTSPNQNRRRMKITGITVHWWGNPVGQKIEGIVDWLCQRRAGTSAHYVVSDGVVYCIVDPDKRAWHAGNSRANHTQIGLELDPNASKREGTMRTAAELIANLRKTYGNLPLYPHRHWTSTQCPGNYDLGALDKLARGQKPSAPAKDTKPAPAKTSDGKLKTDGRWGTVTTKALQRFLNDHVKGAKLKVDGRTGPETWEALQRYLGHPVVDGLIEHQSYKPEELGNGISPNGWRFTGRRSKGSKTVVRLQKWVGVEQDGVVFEGTTKALQRKLNAVM